MATAEPAGAEPRAEHARAGAPGGGRGRGSRSVLLGGLGLRLWGVAQGLPYVYNSRRGRPLRAARGRDVRARTLNPHYFANPPAFTYLLHYLFAIAYGGASGVRHAFELHPQERLHARARRRRGARHARAVAAVPDRRAAVRPRASGCSRRRSRRSRSCRSSTPISRSTTCPRWRRLTLSLLGSAGVLRKGRARDYLLAGVGLGLACATKYTAGIVLVPLLPRRSPRAISTRGPRAAPAGARAGSRSRASLALLAFLIANPYALLDYSELPRRTRAPVDAVGRIAGQARRARKRAASPTTCGRSPGGSAGCPRWPRSAARSRCGARERRLGWLLVPAPLLFLAFMGLQGRYFGRWLLPIFPIAVPARGVLRRAARRRGGRLAERARRRGGGQPGDGAGTRAAGARARRSRSARCSSWRCSRRGSSTASTRASCSRAPTRAT